MEWFAVNDVFKEQTNLENEINKFNIFIKSKIQNEEKRKHLLMQA